MGTVVGQLLPLLKRAERMGKETTELKGGAKKEINHNKGRVSVNLAFTNFIVGFRSNYDFNDPFLESFIDMLSPLLSYCL